MNALLSPLRFLLTGLRLITFFIGTFFTISAFIIHKKFTGSLIGGTWFHRWCTLNFGIHVHVHGTPALNVGRNVLFTPNHVSYADIGATGAILKNCVFVAKGEVENWPLFGWLATLQKTVFIKRLRTAMQGALDDVSNLIGQGYSIILFPEGTTGMGDTVLPFKAGLFELAYATSPKGKMLVQPVAITIDRIDGKPANTQDLRDYYAWWRKEDTLLPHMLKMGTRFRIDISMHFLDVLDPTNFPDRKDLAAAAENAVRSVVEGSRSSAG